MKLDKDESRVFEALTELPVIDAHEHLMPEEARVARKVDFFLLFSHYTRDDLRSAGMGMQEYERLRDDQEMPVEDKWAAFSPYWPLIRHGSYARPALIWIRDVLGCDDLTEANYREISAKLQEWNRPGLYRRILVDMCGIEAALVVNPAYRQYDFDLLKPLWCPFDYTNAGGVRRFLDDASAGDAQHIGGYLDWMAADFRQYMGLGGIGMKTICFPFDKALIGAADGAFRRLRDSSADSALSQEEDRALACAVCDRAFQLARKHDVPVAVHSGVWGDFRQSQPTHLIPMAAGYADVSYDLFHLGMPYVREAVMIGKMFPNVSLNLCWLSVVSPEMTVRMLDECVDLVPMSNIIAFGGDYNLPVEKVYGHLKMAREVVARVLAKRIKRGLMGFDEAVRIARMWFYENPSRIYKLKGHGPAGRSA